MKASIRNNDFIKSSLDTFVFSNVFISLSAVTLSLSSYLVLSPKGLHNASVTLLAFIFFSTLFVYNFYITSYIYPREKSSEKDKWIVSNLSLVKTILGISFAGLIAAALDLSFLQILFLFHLGVLSLLYIFPVRFSGYEFYLRRFPLVKIFVLTYVWTSVTVFLPALDIGWEQFSRIAFVFIERFLFIFALAIPFDIRDYSRDKIESVKTIPGLLGPKAAKKLSIGLLICYMTFSLFGEGVDFPSISRICSGLVAISFIAKVEERASNTFYLIFIDGVMILHFIVLWLAYALAG